MCLFPKLHVFIYNSLPLSSSLSFLPPPTSFLPFFSFSLYPSNSLPPCLYISSSSCAIGRCGEEGRFPGGSVVKNLPANARDVDSISGSGRFPGVGNGSPLQYSCWENFQRQRSLAIYVSMRLQRVEHDCNDLACTCIIRFSNSIPGYLSEENKNTNSKICMHPNVHCNIISNSEDI